MSPSPSSPSPRPGSSASRRSACRRLGGGAAAALRGALRLQDRGQHALPPTPVHCVVPPSYANGIVAFSAVCSTPGQPINWCAFGLSPTGQMVPSEAWVLQADASSGAVVRRRGRRLCTSLLWLLRGLPPPPLLHSCSTWRTATSLRTARRRATRPRQGGGLICTALTRLDVPLVPAAGLNARVLLLVPDARHHLCYLDSARYPLPCPSCPGLRKLHRRCVPVHRVFAASPRVCHSLPALQALPPSLLQCFRACRRFPSPRAGPSRSTTSTAHSL